MVRKSSRKKPKTVDDDSVNDAETVLYNFDMDPSYGPKLGISRSQRLERAINLNLNPPNAVFAALKSNPSLDLLFPSQ